MNVNVICLSYLYSAVSLTLVREKRLIRIIYYLFLFFIVVFCWVFVGGFVCFFVLLFVLLLLFVCLLFCLFVVFVVLLTTVFPRQTRHAHIRTHECSRVRLL